MSHGDDTLELIEVEEVVKKAGITQAVSSAFNLEGLTPVSSLIGNTASKNTAVSSTTRKMLFSMNIWNRPQ